MSCCGRSRAVWPGDAQATVSGQVSEGTVRLRWRRRVSATVTGPATGVSYPVSATLPVITVDARDTRGLLATGFFERVG